MLETLKEIQDFLFTQKETWIPLQELEKQCKYPLIRNGIGECYYVQTDEGMLQVNVREFEKVPYVSKFISLEKVDEYLLEKSIKTLQPFAEMFNNLIQMQAFMKDHPNTQADSLDFESVLDSKHFEGIDVNYQIKQAKKTLGIKVPSGLDVEYFVKQAEDLLYNKNISREDVQFRRGKYYRKDKK